MKTNDPLAVYGKIVNALSFSAELYKLRRELNSRIDQPGTILREPQSHPVGIARWFKKRRISIAESYIMVVQELRSKNARERLRALKVMIDASFHSKTLDLPLNTARVQLALIKEAVKNRSNWRRQLELLQDFSIASHGQYQVIRRLLDELGIPELPETGQRLKNLDAGWDDHVHDTATTGRKNPTQLLIDAFIKGISELTIAYASASATDSMKEAVEAGKIVGIRVNVALEFSALVMGRRFHFMALLPQFKSSKELSKWFETNRSTMRPIFEGLERNQENRVEAVRSLLDHFNANGRKEINADYPDDELFILPKLKLRELLETVPRASVNRYHLGEFLYNAYKPVLFNRIMAAKVQAGKVKRSFRKHLASEWEAKIAEERYIKLRREYRSLSAEGLRQQYFTNLDIGDYQTVFTDLPKVRRIIAQAGCRLRVLHPLEHGFDAARRMLEAMTGVIDQVELYNMQDASKRDPEEILSLARLLNRLNADAAARNGPVYVPVCGSDSTGRTPGIPGMGFIRKDRLTGKYRRRYEKRHVALPQPVAALIAAAGKTATPEFTASVPPILSMGKVAGKAINLLGDEPDSEWAKIPPAKALRYLNPTLVNLLHVAVGFVVAERYVGPFYASLWLVITAFRNSVADLVAGRGTRLREWNLRSINTGNVARSLFWTGFSVPLLGFVKARFDVLWPFVASGFVFEATKFFFISFTNGLYLATHNTLRGFDRSVVRANFFRSVLAWPLATVTAPLGKLLGIPSIVQAKIWSDFVAGIIEGRSKYRKIVGLSRRDIEEIVPQVLSDDQEDRFTALLDLLYVFREQPRTETSLRSVLADCQEAKTAGDEKDGPPCGFEDFGAILMDDDLDRPLIDFILSRYPPDMAAELMNLVATTLPEFRDWMAAMLKQVRRDTGGLAARAADVPAATGFGGDAVE